MGNLGTLLTQVQLRKQQISAAKKAAEIVTLHEWYESFQPGQELEEYFKYYSNLGRLGRELHKHRVIRVIELYQDLDRSPTIEAAFDRLDLSFRSFYAIMCFSLLDDIRKAEII